MNIAPDPFDPAKPGLDDPLLDRIRTALRAQDSAKVVSTLTAARADLGDRLRDVSYRSSSAANPGRPARKARRRWPSYLGYAALSCALVTFAGVALHRHTTPAPAAHIYKTSVAQQATVTLADGSRAILGPATTLSVRRNASDGGMTATLEGQALFTVAHHSRAPFIVRVSRTATRVLGTTFFVREYPADRSARIAVLDGRVSVWDERPGHARASAVLSRGLLAMAADSEPMIVMPVTSPDDYSAWTTGRLVFHDTPVADVVVELSRTYGADIRVADSALAGKTMTWTVPVAQRSLTGVLDVLSVTLNAHLVRLGTTIVITPGRPVPKKTSLPTSSSQEPQYGR